MKNWGYTITRPRVIDLGAADLRAAERLQEIVPALRACIGCGNCTATCTAGAIAPFNIRRLQTLLRRGEMAALGAEIDKCMLCGKCKMVCPRGINTRKMIVTIKRLLES